MSDQKTIFKIALFKGLFLLILTPTLFASDKDSTSTSKEERDSIVLQKDDPVIQAMDSLAQSIYYRRDSFSVDTAELNTYGFPADSVPDYSDSVYKARMENLDRMSPVQLDHNEIVNAYIDLYAKKRRDLTSRLLGLKEVYFPMIEAKLDQHGIPLELKYLAIVESALNPTARSRAGATGLWQFMYRTGLLYDLEVNSYVDQRMDPVKSTEAACDYLNFLYGIYDDWHLVLAAYNAGPGTVNRALRRAGGGKMSYWDLRPYLPRETRGYVPAFIAVNYVMNHHKEHNIYPVEPKFRSFQTDTIHVKKKVSFKQIAQYMEIPMDTLEFLNPVYKRKEIPGSDGYDVLRLPVPSIGDFMANQDSIYQYKEKPEVENGYVTKRITKIHRVRSGEYLGYIAGRYNCSVRDIMTWNGMRSSRIHPGQRLTIHKTVRKKVDSAKGEEDTASTEEDKAEEQGSSPEFRYHIVQRGDTLWDIARKYSGVTVRELRQLNQSVRSKGLKPGQKIKVKVSG